MLKPDALKPNKLKKLIQDFTHHFIFERRGLYDILLFFSPLSYHISKQTDKYNHIIQIFCPVIYS